MTESLLELDEEILIEPPEETKRITIIVPSELDRRWEVYCAATEQTKSNVFAKAVDEFIDNLPEDKRISLHNLLEAFEPKDR